MVRILSIFALVLLAAGCASAPQPVEARRALSAEGSPRPDAGAASDAAAATGEPVTIKFFDSRIFDRELSRAMQARSSEIVVDVPVGFNLNEIPERVDRWLYSVKDSGGEVVAEPEIRTRGVLSAAIDVVVSFFGQIADRITFAPSDQYSAKLVYKSDGTVRKLVFARR